MEQVKRPVGRPRKKEIPVQARLTAEVGRLMKDQAAVYGVAPSAYASLLLSEAVLTASMAEAASHALRRAKNETT